MWLYRSVTFVAGVTAFLEYYVSGATLKCPAAVPEKKAVFGSCIEACSPALGILGQSDCAEGYVCRSNGCGHTCQLATEVAKRRVCSLVMCDLFCETGYAVDEHGCHLCQCRSTAA